MNGLIFTISLYAISYSFVKANVNETTNKIIMLESKVSLLTGALNRTLDKYERVMERLEHLESKVDNTRQRRQPDGAVAFHAHMSSTRCIQQHETFVFDVEDIDVGNGYSPSDGLYIVPMSGVYAFTVTLVPDFFHYNQAEIIINGVVKEAAFGDSQEIHDLHPATAFLIASVQGGDHVMIRRGRGTCNVFSDISYASRTTFSGWRIGDI